MNPNFRNFALWAIIALLLIALFSMFQQPAERDGLARDSLIRSS